MTIVQEDREVLGVMSSGEAGPDGVVYRVEVGRTHDSMDFIATRRCVSGAAAPFTHVRDAPTVMGLESEIHALCFDMAMAACPDRDAADELGRLFRAVMADASERVRVANRTTRQPDSPCWFEVGIFRWGEHDFELACRCVRARADAPSCPEEFDRSFQGSTLGDAQAAARRFLALLARAAVDDDHRQARLEEFLDACDLVVAEARRKLATNGSSGG